MSESPFVYETGQQEARRMWWTILIGTLICSVSVLWLPTTYSEADDLRTHDSGRRGWVRCCSGSSILSFSLNQLFVQLYQWFLDLLVWRSVGDDAECRAFVIVLLSVVQT